MTANKTSDRAGVTAGLSRFVATTSLADVPPEVVERAKHLILDGLACGLLAAKLDWSRRAVETLQSLEGDGKATIWGWNRSAPSTTAALLNGTFVQGFELDDYHPFGPLHSQACVIPSVLGTAEQLGSVDGRRFLEAVLLGFEVGPRVGIAMGGLDLVTRGWHCGAVYGVMASAAGAGRLRRLDAAQQEDAFGIAATRRPCIFSSKDSASAGR